MKVAITLLILLVIAVVVVRVSKSTGAQPKTIEERLAVLESCGFKLAAPFTINDLLKSWSREEYEVRQWDTILVGLGMTEEAPPWRPRCETLWHFDTECIEDHGDYAAIVKRMTGLTNGSLPLVNIEDHVDIENGEAWFSFTLNGQLVRVDASVDGDWVDASVFKTFVDLLDKTDPSKVFVYYDLGGQDCLIGCTTRSGFSNLRKNKVGFVKLS